MTVAAPIVADSVGVLSKTAGGSTRATREMLSRLGDRRGGRGGVESLAALLCVPRRSRFFLSTWNSLWAAKENRQRTLN